MQAMGNRANKSATLLTELTSLKDHKVFKERYKVLGSQAARSPATASSTPRGKSSSLVLVKSKDTGSEYVCRTLDRRRMPTADRDAVQRHLQQLNGLEHPHLCKFVEAFEDGDRLFLVYEKAQDVTLFEHIGSCDAFGEDDAAEYVRQIAMALAVAHEEGIVHGCLNPNKLLVETEDCFADVSPREDTDDGDDGQPLPAQVKVCDMGQVLVLKESAVQALQRSLKEPQEAGDGAASTNASMTAASGSSAPHRAAVECIAPELAWGEVTEAEPGAAEAAAQKLDIWSLGCIVYHMLTGGPPLGFGVEAKGELLEVIKAKSVTFEKEWSSRLSPEARDAAEKLLMVNAGLRPTAGAVLRHPWVRLRRERLSKVQMQRLLACIRENVSEGHFKRMVMRIISQQLPMGTREVRNIERAYRFFDKNGDGVLGVPEIVSGARKLALLSEADLVELERALELLDRDGSRTVSLQEFIAGALDVRRALSYENLWHAFNAFDRDGNGGVNVDEIESIIRQVDAGLLGQEQVDGLVQCIRSEIKGVTYKDHIDFDQFVYIMSTPTGAPDRGLALRRDFSRWAHTCCRVDTYSTRRVKPKEWVWAARGSASVYRRASLVSGCRRGSLLDIDVPAEKASPGRENERPSPGRRRPQNGRQPSQGGVR